MNELHFPWLEVTIALLLSGAVWVRQLKNPHQARLHCVVIMSLSFLLTVGAWIDYSQLGVDSAQNSWFHSFGPKILEVDQINAPLIPLVALLYLLTAVATMRTKVRRFSFVWSLVREAALLSAFACREPWAVIACLCVGTVNPWLELRWRGEPTRLYSLYMLVYIASLVSGQALVNLGSEHSVIELAGVGLLALAVLIRTGIFPFQSWMPDLFSRATFGTAMLYVVPMQGAYAAVRLLLPVAPDWVMHAVALLSLFTAVYAAGMALVQAEARRFYSYLFLSHSSLVLVGLELATPIGLTGALSLWLSVGLALGGFGLTLRCMESRLGPFTLTTYRGLYQHTPTLAAFFLLTGLASVGFPGTFGFVGAELIVEGAVQVYPLVGMVVVVAAALNGIAVVMAYLRIFTGTQHHSSISLKILPPERFAVLILTMLILGGGLWPQPGIQAQYHAAMAIVNSRRGLSTPVEHPEHVPAHEPATGASASGWQWLIGQDAPQPKSDRGHL